MDRRDELNDKDLKPFLELTMIAALAAVLAVAALIHGDNFFGVFFGATTGITASDLIRRAVDL
jgi:hypothetical protein